MTLRPSLRSLSLALTLALAGGTFGTAHASTPKGFKLYTSKQFKFAVAYPSKWTVTAPLGLPWFIDGKNIAHNHGAVIVSPPLPMASVSVDQFVALVTKGFKKDSKGMKTAKIRVAGSDARLITGVNKGNQPYAIAAFLGHGRAWNILMGANKGDFSRNLEVFRAMLATFSFT